jgi:glucose/arabinose dehydrogenase
VIRKLLPYAAITVVMAALFGVVTKALGLPPWRTGYSVARHSTFTPVISGLDAPTEVRSAPGDPATLYAVEQPGTIRIVRNGSITGTFLDIRSKVKAGGEQGLLSLAFSPRYASNHLFYVYYTDTEGNSRVVEYRSVDGVADPSSARELLFVRQPYSNHNGGDLQFDGHGFLYFGLGDGGSAGDPQQNAQNMSSRLGKLLRTNPLRPGSGWRIVALGLRNPWRYSFDPANGNLWIADVGQNKYEEIDYRPASRVGRLANYGWSRYEGNSVFSSHPLTKRGDLVAPVLVYSHALGCSVTGGYVVHGRYWYGDYCSGTVWSFRAGNGRLSAARVEGKVPALSSFGVGGDGTLYATSLTGTVYRIG